MIYLLLMLASGCLIAMQSPINAALGKSTGALEAGFISFGCGFLALGACVALFGKGDLAKVALTPPWQWCGGFLGAIMVVTAILAVPRIGVLSTGLAMILGNLVMAAVIDNFGWFGVPVTSFTVRRCLGVALVLSGLFLVFKK